MTKIAHSTIINAPLKEVFKYASDWRKWEEWFEGVFKFAPTTDLPHGNGARYKYKAKLMKTTFVIETEIYDFEENVGWRGKATKGMEHGTFWNFEDMGNNTTKFTYGLEYKMPIPVIGNWIDSKWVKPQWDKIIQNSLQNISKILNQ